MPTKPSQITKGSKVRIDGAGRIYTVLHTRPAIAGHDNLLALNCQEGCLISLLRKSGLKVYRTNLLTPA